MADPAVPETVSPAPAPGVSAPPAPPAAITPSVAASPTAPEPAAPPAAPSPPAPPAAQTQTEAKPAEPAPAPVPAEPAPTLLEKFDKEKADTEAAKAAAAKPAEPPKPVETKPAEPAKPTLVSAAQAPVEYKYTLPETIKMDDAMRGEVHKAFDDFRANPTEGAQALINLHERTMRDYAQFLSREQHRIFAETRQSWAKQVLSDPEIGGSGHQTAMGAIARMRDLLVPERERPAFEEFLRVTGAGDHPAFLKLLHQAARYYDEPTVPPPNPRPAPGNGQRPSRRLRDIYDHPRSTAEGRS